MEFEWEETKRQRNIRDHKVDFVDAAQLFDGRPTFTYYSPRNDEDRWGTVGAMADGKLYLEETMTVDLPAPKEQITLRLDREMLVWFRTRGKGYQTLMNAVLRGYYEHERLHTDRHAPR